MPPHVNPAVEHEVPGNVVGVQAVSMLALVQASRSAEGACAAFSGGGALHEARDARGVVTADTHCAAADIGGIRHDIQVTDGTGLLQVAVGDVAFSRAPCRFAMT